LLDAIQGATLAAFKVPERDRYQIVHKHPLAEMRIEDTGLDIPRTGRIVMVQVTTRPRSRWKNRLSMSCFARNYFGAVGSRRRTSLSQLRKMLMKTGLSETAEPSSLPENFDPEDGLNIGCHGQANTVSRRESATTFAKLPQTIWAVWSGVFLRRGTISLAGEEPKRKMRSESVHSIRRGPPNQFSI
jgi:hypothetical protein